MNGLAVSSDSSRTSERSMSVAMIGVPASRAASASFAAATTGASSFLPFASFSSRGIAFSTVCRSARISSVEIVEMSLAGLTSPSTWVTSSSRKTRVTWQIAADSRMWARNLLPRPSPSEAPRTMPAMSTKDWATNLGGDRSSKLTIYRDPNAKLADEFAIPNGYKFHGQTVHFPALVLLDASGKEVFRYIGKNNTDRYPYEKFSARLQELTSQSSK